MDGELVWFGADSRQFYNDIINVFGRDLFRYDLAFGMKGCENPLQRLEYTGESIESPMVRKSFGGRSIEAVRFWKVLTS